MYGCWKYRRDNVWNMSNKPFARVARDTSHTGQPLFAASQARVEKVLAGSDSEVVTSFVSSARSRPINYSNLMTARQGSTDGFQGYNWFPSSSSIIIASTGQLSAAFIKVSSSTDSGFRTTALLFLSSLNTVGAAATQLPAPMQRSLSTFTFNGCLRRISTNGVFS
jgi:hypothetical protein